MHIIWEIYSSYYDILIIDVIKIAINWYHRDDNIVWKQTFMQGWVIITTHALSIVEVGRIQFCNNNFATIVSVVDTLDKC